MTGVPTHLPSALHMSSVVQELPSLHGAPGVGLNVHWPSTQESAVQALWSSQTIGVPAHVPSVLQVSPVVQGLPSSHAGSVGAPVDRLMLSKKTGGPLGSPPTKSSILM